MYWTGYQKNLFDNSRNKETIYFILIPADIKEMSKNFIQFRKKI